jgi:hypothetical protein
VLAIGSLCREASTTETVYAHLLGVDHSDAMAALAALETGPNYGPNVAPLWG